MLARSLYSGLYLDVVNETLQAHDQSRPGGARGTVTVSADIDIYSSFATSPTLLVNWAALSVYCHHRCISENAWPSFSGSSARMLPTSSHAKSNDSPASRSWTRRYKPH